MLSKNQEEIMKEIRDYFKKREEEHLEYDGHPLSSVEDLMDPDVAAPWDHLEDWIRDEDMDDDIKNLVGK